MGTKQTFATTVPLKSDPRNILHDPGKSFNPQSTSTKVPLQSEPSTVKYGAGTPDGIRQMNSAETVKLNQKPMSGWQSYDTPMSDRTITQKKNF